MIVSNAGFSDSSSFNRGIVAMLLLVVLLIARELAAAAADSSGNLRTRTFARTVKNVLLIPVVPLMLVFWYNVAFKVASMLQ